MITGNANVGKKNDEIPTAQVPAHHIFFNKYVDKRNNEQQLSVEVEDFTVPTSLKIHPQRIADILEFTMDVKPQTTSRKRSVLTAYSITTEFNASDGS